MDGYESLEIQPFQNRGHLVGICRTASALRDDSSVHHGCMDYATITIPQLVRDGASTMSVHMDKMVGIRFFHLRQLRLVRRKMNVAAHAHVRTLIHSGLDYCKCVGWTVSIHVQATSVCLECGSSARLSVTRCVNPDDGEAATRPDFHIESHTNRESQSAWRAPRR